MGKDNKSLGRALVKDRFGASKGKKRVDNGSMLHTTEVQDGYDWGRLNLQSVTEESSFQEFLSTAQLAGTEFQAEKLNLKLVSIGGVEAVTSCEARAKAKEKHAECRHLLRVPRRPQWSKEMGAEQLSDNEKQAFLNWRRDLAVLQEQDGIIMTPYEKNLEFWRQLWRVLERSQLLVQVLDARNPLLFRCEDLENYAREVGVKSLLLLLNKADLLSPQQREMWAKYFDEQGMRVAFFSAMLAVEQTKLDKKKHAEENENNFDEESESGEESDEEKSEEPEENISNLQVVNTVEDLLKGINTLNAAVDKTAEKIKNFEGKLTQLAEIEPAAHAVRTESKETLTVDTSKPEDNVNSLISNLDNTNTQPTVVNSDSNQDEILCKKSGNEKDTTTGDKKKVSFDKILVEDDNGECSSCESPSSSNDSKLFSEDKIYAVKSVKNSPDILTREQLIELFTKVGETLKTDDKRFTIGMVGYPNVGKSSTINALMTAKKVSVSATPGKTKHFQTLILTDDLMLCDCPGLVLPSFVCTKADMIVHGILPIDQMREYIEATTILAECIGRRTAEVKLGILLPPAPEDRPNYLPPRDLLLAYAYSRGMMTGAGSPDCARAARALLRLACIGKLSVAQAPPGNDVEMFRQEECIEGEVQTRNMTPQERRALKSGDTAEDVDNAFFKGPGLAAHAKGIQGKFTGLPKVRVRTVNGSALHEMEVSGKPWKHFNKHANKKKKEKLRRIYGHLDQH